MALADASRGRLDLSSLTHVANLGLGIDLARDALEPLPAAREEDAPPLTGGELPGERRSDPA